jgi:hypothetical protein
MKLEEGTEVTQSHLGPPQAHLGLISMMVITAPGFRSLVWLCASSLVSSCPEPTPG